MPINKTIAQRAVFFAKFFIHLISLYFLIELYYQAFNDGLGADPVEVVIHFTGIGAFNLLILTLLVTPLAKHFKVGWLLQIRRLLGLYCFTYALCHLINFIAFDLQFEWLLFLGEVVKRPYITFGLAAFIILLVLALTSISTLKRKMGSRWQKLHNFVYIALCLVAIHFYWSVKSELIQPSIYVLLSAFLLWLRKDKFLRWLKLQKK